MLPLFDSGSAGGLLYYVMPYVDGESLRSKLARERQLPIDEAVHLATAIASALDYTHRHGVIHRDLKPENILLHEGQPLIADFGIALAVSNAAGDRITQTGLSLGTPHYMSPEQATGDEVIDGRTDIYSLGALTYEMLAAEPPHTGRTAKAIIGRLLIEPVRSIRSSRPSVPAHVEDAVMRALEKLPADRWSTAHAFADALAGRGPTVANSRGGRRVVMRAAAIVAVVAIAAIGAWYIDVPAHGADGRSISFAIDAPIYEGVRQTTLDFAISPDGGTLAIVAYPFDPSRARVYLRRLSAPSASPIPGTEGASYVAFSPDGKWLSIATFGGNLLRVPVDGTTGPITLADGIDGYNGIAWADNETIALGSALPNRRGLGSIAATGGAVHTLRSPLTIAYWPCSRATVACNSSLPRIGYPNCALVSPAVNSDRRVQ